jgi:hypothetical protein
VSPEARRPGGGSGPKAGAPGGATRLHPGRQGKEWRRFLSASNNTSRIKRNKTYDKCFKKIASASTEFAYAKARPGADSHILTTIPKTVKHPATINSRCCLIFCDTVLDH